MRQKKNLTRGGGTFVDMTVKEIERIWVDVPFREIPAKHMVRELPHWTLFEICKVTLACGVVGFGETMCYYTWGQVTEKAVREVQGKNAADYLWRDDLGAGLQMALFDAVGKAMDVPCHRLMGKKVRDRAFISWWDIDMDAEDWVKECRRAIDLGYTNFKTKARPWFDLRSQTATLSRELPDWFEIDLDFNGMLVNTAGATRVLRDVEKFSQVAIFESPIPQGDVMGNKHLRRSTRVPIAMHYGNPPILTALREDVCDGFVLSGGASRLLEQAAVAAAADKVFWLQLVGTGITATFALHLAAVLTHARWPSVNCHQLYQRSMLKSELEVFNGTCAVPEAPGLGVQLDEEAVDTYRIQPIDKPYPAPGLLLAIRWPSASTSYYAHTQQFWDDFLGGRLPVFAEGVHLDNIPDDGSREWSDLQERAAAGGVHVGARPI